MGGGMLSWLWELIEAWEQPAGVEPRIQMHQGYHYYGSAWLNTGQCALTNPLCSTGSPLQP